MRRCPICNQLRPTCEFTEYRDKAGRVYFLCDSCKKMKWYEVFTKMTTYWGDGLDPPEEYYDWYVVKAKNARAAKVEAVKYWRTRKESSINYYPDENPFTGLKTRQMLPDEGQTLEEFELMMEQMQKDERER